LLPPPADERVGAIVLVHGAWVGEWAWTPVLPMLRASGRPVHAVSLTGHGARRHESGPHVVLADHIADVVGVIEAYDLSDVTLVGHSYGGRVVTPVYEQLPDRIRRLVYLDAHVPVLPATGALDERTAIAEANAGMLPFADYDPDPDEVGGAEGVAWFMDRVVPHSFATFTEPLVGDLPADLPKTYVYANSGHTSRFAAYADVIRDDPDWRFVELEGSHWLMFARPDEVARIILE
jgi:pimeloyl-ACP methyl ester carboxylesterase